MKKLYFRDSHGNERLISDNCENPENDIHYFLTQKNYKSYYTRTWIEEDGSKWFDVGSHTEFFILRECEE